MGGNSKGEQAPTTSANVVASQPAYLKNTAPATMPAFMPGQQQALATQLATGFGGTPKAFSDMLAQIYQPAQTLNFNAAPKPKPAAKTAPKPGPTTSPLNVAKPSDKYTYLGGRNAR